MFPRILYKKGIGSGEWQEKQKGNTNVDLLLLNPLLFLERLVDSKWEKKKNW